MPKTNVDKVGRFIRNFNNGLRGLMKREKVSQETLAKYLNISRVSMTHRMTGQTKWSLEDAYKVCDYFDTSLEEIIGRS